MRKNKAIAIIAAICAVSIAGGVVGYTVGQRSEYMTIGAPHATPSEMPEGITVGAVGAITVPGYERMSFKAFNRAPFGERDLSLQRAPAG